MLGILVAKAVPLVFVLVYVLVLAHHCGFIGHTTPVDPLHSPNPILAFVSDKKRITVFVFYFWLKFVVMMLFKSEHREEAATLSGLDWFVYSLWPGFRPELLVPAPGNSGGSTAAQDDNLDETTKEDFLFSLIFILAGGLWCTHIRTHCHDGDITQCEPLRSSQVQAVPALSVFLYLGLLRLAHAFWRLCGYERIQVPYKKPYCSESLSEFWGFEDITARPSARSTSEFPAEVCVFLADMNRALVKRPLDTLFQDNEWDQGAQGYLVFCWIFCSFFLTGSLLEAGLAAPVWQGFGKPMLYALSQALLVFVEKSEWPAVAELCRISVNLRAILGRGYVILAWFLPLAILVASLPAFCEEVAWPWAMRIGDGAHALIFLVDHDR